MAAFREYSDRLPFRERSENAEIATELSLQPWRAFRPDGVIMFSDILTPLPAMGIEFDVVPKRGPIIEVPIRSMQQVRELQPLEDPDSSLPFIRQILGNLRREVGQQSTVLGFVGAPWTLAAYAIQGQSDRHCQHAKGMMLKNPAVLHALLEHLADGIADYACHQAACGAQVVQLFDSWAHYLSPGQFAEFGLPYAAKVISLCRQRCPSTPLIYHAKGGTGKLHLMKQSGADVIGLDWGVDMALARQELGSTCVQGNVDPMTLFASEDCIRTAVQDCLSKAESSRHILNVGDGVMQGTPEASVGLFCELARQTANSRELVGAA